MRILVRLAAAAAVALSLSACATTIAPRPDLVAAGVSAPVVQGKATVVESPELASKTISAHPTSLTGAATTLNVPIGEVIRVVGEKVLNAGFSGGAASGAASGGSYAVKVNLDEFSYAYDQASNLGFAITPKVTIGITADVLTPDGKTLLHKSYVERDFSAGKYVIAGQPPEKINKALHLALGQIFRNLLDDIAAAANTGAA